MSEHRSQPEQTSKGGTPEDTLIRAVLETCRHVALVGASAKPERDSYKVMAYLLEQGYAVHPVNPGLAGQTILNQPVFGNLAEVPAPVEMVDIFRNAEAAGEVVDEALEQSQRLGLQAIWMQENVVNEPAAARARATGLRVVMDRCPKVELPRLGLAPQPETETETETEADSETAPETE
ncbi:MAG: CoA-binding protein [Kiloniella sp.]|nr:CoA-binding protein [Kiloniella sp.]